MLIGVGRGEERPLYNKEERPPIHVDVIAGPEVGHRCPSSSVRKEASRGVQQPAAEAVTSAGVPVLLASENTRKL